MTKQQINKLDNNQSFLVLKPKKFIDVVKPPRNTGAKQPTLREILLDIQKDVKELQQWRKTVNAKFEAIDALFKAHDWIK